MTQQTLAKAPTPASAALWRRFAALGYDILILGGLSMAYGAAATGLVALTQNQLTQNYTPMLKGPIYFCGWVLVILIFYCGFWWKSGQTIGMRAWKIRLISITPNSPEENHFLNPNLQQVLRRSFWGVLGFWLCGLGYAYRWFDVNQDCWHDYKSGTRVIVVTQ